MKGFDDLRIWLEKVDKIGELSRVEDASWNQEIGCITQLNAGAEAPALLFDNITDYPPGYRVLASALKTPARLALTLNIPASHLRSKLSQALIQKLNDWEARIDEFPPEIVSSGSVLENVCSGKGLDLLRFPAPKWHDLDGGRYIGTGSAIITRDPESGQINLGTYRIMVHDNKTVGFHTAPGHHGNIHRQRYHERKQKCPVAVSIGHHPLFLIAGSLPLPPGSEYNYIGAIREKPVKVIKEEVTGLPIPADSEIVIAGWCPPGKQRMEGPFGEWHGYYASKTRPDPIIEVERIYYRNDPIIFGCPPYRPPNDSTYYMNTLRSAVLHNELVKSGIPDVKGVWLSDAGGRTFTTVSIKQRYAGHARQAALIASQSQVAAYVGRYVIVVDEDIDPSNINDVVWALCFRTDPEKDIDIIRRNWSGSIDPIIRKPAEVYVTSKAIIDACKPYEWIDEFPQEVKVNPEVEKKVREKWGGTLKI